MENLFDWQWQDYAELGSTNDLAVELSASAPAPRYVITAQRQTAGRGRRGRGWQSFEGNLFMSLALEENTQTWNELVFVVSLALAETICSLYPQKEVALKWPNDVLVGGGKVSGILLEKGAGLYIIIGIGVNIAAAPQQDGQVLYPTTSLAANGIKIDRLVFLKAFLQQFNHYLALRQEQGFALIREKWLRLAKGLNEEIRVNLPTKSLNGIFRGLDDNGLLLFETDGKIQKIAAGDVFFATAEQGEDKK